MKQYFDQTNQRLVFISKKANPAFWDQHWNQCLNKKIYQDRISSFDPVLRITKKFLSPGSKVLEGGCGLGQNVSKLSLQGYKVWGVDYAPQTVRRAKEYFSKLNIKKADVKNLPFPANYFDGYWSIGVIEHYYQGYEEIFAEMARVIKKEGFLFLSFPYMSCWRKTKAKLNFYPPWQEDKNLRENFYQFALEGNKVKEDLKTQGFREVARYYLDATKGLKDECRLLKPILQKIYDAQFQGINFLISLLGSRFMGHSLLLVLKKEF